MYAYSIHFYGPYSEDLHTEVGLLESLGLVRERTRLAQSGNQYHILEATEEARLPEIEEFQPSIDVLQAEDAIVLELAATYDAFRLGGDHATALKRLRRKKGRKCDDGREDRALNLLRTIKLPVEDAI
jgi:uncharacterized protein YwgA